MGVYALVIVALYPSFKNDTSLNKFTENGSTVAALFGANGPLTTPTGWLNANLYANFVPLIVLLLTIGYGASCLAGQDEDGTLGLIAALPIARRRIADPEVRHNEPAGHRGCRSSLHCARSPAADSISP